MRKPGKVPYSNDILCYFELCTVSLFRYKSVLYSHPPLYAPEHCFLNYEPSEIITEHSSELLLARKLNKVRPGCMTVLGYNLIILFVKKFGSYVEQTNIVEK